MAPLSLYLRRGAGRSGPVLCTVMFALAVDQVAKLAALGGLAPGQTLPMLPGLNLTLAFNTGASFGLLSGLMAGRPLLMALLTGMLAFAFLFMALRVNNPAERIGLAMISGGAAGNIVDRVRQGAVTDFIDVYWRDLHWPAFNLADVAITCGAALILATTLFSRSNPGGADA